jgi:hypothetical protein
LNHRLWKGYIGEIFIIGGVTLFNEMLSNEKDCTSVFATKIMHDFKTDITLPKDEYIAEVYTQSEITTPRTCEKEGYSYYFSRHINKNSYKYHSLVTEKAFEDSSRRIDIADYKAEQKRMKEEVARKKAGVLAKEKLKTRMPPLKEPYYVFMNISISGKDIGKIVFKLFQDCPSTAENFKCLCTGEMGIGTV